MSSFAYQVSMKAEMEMAMKLLEKDVHEKQDTIISLRDQLDEIKTINMDMYSKLKVTRIRRSLNSGEQTQTIHRLELIILFLVFNTLCGITQCLSSKSYFRSASPSWVRKAKSWPDSRPRLKISADCCSEWIKCHVEDVLNLCYKRTVCCLPLLLVAQSFQECEHLLKLKTDAILQLEDKCSTDVDVDKIHDRHGAQ